MASITPFALLCGLAAVVVNAQPAQNGYVGSKACFGCHTAIFQSFKKTAMGRSLVPAADWKPDVLPPNAVLAQPGTSRSFAVSHTAAGWAQSESEAGAPTASYPLDYAVGSGQNGLTFLIRRGAYLFQAPLSYYSRAARWDFSPGYENTDLGFSRMVPQECINCHAGRPAPVPNSYGAYADPPFQELAIGCENCHGPGAAHVLSRGKQHSSIVNPAKLEHRLAENICLNCHQTGDVRVLQQGKTYLDFRPGQWLFNTLVILRQPAHTAEQQQADLLDHHSAMQSSRCFRESGGKLSCLTCHDPHVQPSGNEAIAYYRAKCLTCHDEQSCRIPLKVRLAQERPNDCTGCHMPKRKVLQISHSALTNHRIPAREGEPLPQLAQNETDGVVVINPPEGSRFELSKLVLLSAYRELSQTNGEFQGRYSSVLEELSHTQPDDPLVQAAIGDKALAEGRPEEAVEHLVRAATTRNPTLYLELGQTLAKLGHSEEAIEYLKKAVAADPYDAVMQKTLILQYINTKNYVEARQLMEQYVVTFPDDLFMRNLLTRVGK